MKTINVKKDKLLTTLRKNKKGHEKQYEELVQDYRKQVVLAVQQFAKKVKKQAPKATKKPVKAYMEHIPFPENHSEDYDRAIKMLEWHTEDEISLSEQEFTNFIQDEWDWTRSFAATSSTLTSNKLKKFNYS